MDYDRQPLPLHTAERQVLEALIQALSEAFEGQATIKSVPAQRSNSSTAFEPSGLLEIQVASKTLKVYVEVRKDIYPRDIRNIAWRFDNYLREKGHPSEMIGMLAAASLSPGAKQALKEQNIASFDLNGSLYLKHDVWLINIEKPLSRTKKKIQGVDLFTDAREGVVHALLLRAREWMKGDELAEQAHTSPYTCSRVLQELTLREWVESVGGGPGKRRMLIQPGKLLDAWAEEWQSRKEPQTRWYTFVEEPKHLLAELAGRIERRDVDFPWAFTGTAAANSLAPLLTSTEHAEIIVPKGYAERMASVLGLRSVSKGANVTLIERESASLLFRHRHPQLAAFFASPYIVYLDLLNGRGRNKELAEHLRERLETSWEKN